MTPAPAAHLIGGAFVEVTLVHHDARLGTDPYIQSYTAATPTRIRYVSQESLDRWRRRHLADLRMCEIEDAANAQAMGD